MKIEITKGFKHEYNFKSVTMYSNIGFKHTNVFWDIHNYVKELGGILDFERINDDINEIICSSKSSCNKVLHDDRIEIFKPNKRIFPEILIIKNAL